MFSHKHGHPSAQRRSQNKGRKGKSNSKSSAFNWAAYRNRCTSLNLLRWSKTRADALVETCDGYSERVHWQVMIALCPELIKRSGFSENPDPYKGVSCRKIKLPCRIGQEMARLLVDCAYGERQLSLDKSNLDQFFALCLEYHIDHGISVCLNFSRKILDPLNCVYMFKLALQFRHLKLKCAAYSMMRCNFKQILQINPDFHRLEQRYLESLLKDNSLRLNDDEELVWLAILRWLRKRPMTQVRLTNLYNQMVSGPQDVLINLFQNNALQRVALDQPEVMRRHSVSGQQRQHQQQQQQQPVRILLNFYSPGYPFCKEQQRQPRGLSSIVASPPPLRRFVDNDQDKVHVSELLALIKCLRYMRLKSVTAFNVIASNRFVSSNEKLARLVNIMRIRYKLRHKIELTNEDKQSISPQYLAKLKLRESTRTQRLVKRVLHLVGWQPLEQQGDVSESQAGVAAESLKAESTEMHEFDEPMERCAEPRVPSSVGFLFGGWQDGAISKTIWAYDFVFDRWFKLNIRLPEARALHASCASPTNGHIYIFGGTDGARILNSVWRFNPYGDVGQTSERCKSDSLPFKNRVTKKSNLLKRTIEYRLSAIGGTEARKKRLSYRFKQLCPMSEPRCHLAGVFHSDGRLYALGGHNGDQRLRSAEWYDPKSNQWHRIADMMIARSDAAACSHQGKIFIAGGHISDQLIQSSVEFYKSSDDSWTFLAPMIIPRMSFCLVSYRSQLLALGGTNGLMGGDEVASVTRSVERYNHDSASWTFCAPMAQKRCSFAAMVIENKLIVLGGHGGYRRLKKCELLRVGQFSAAQGPNNEIPPPLYQPGPFPLTNNQPQADAAVPNRQAAGGNQLRSNSIATTGMNVALHQLREGNNQLSLRIFDWDNQRNDQVTFRSALKWVQRADLPERRSGFSVAVVPELRNARDYTYFGSLVTARRRARNNLEANEEPYSLIRPPSRWKRFKIIKKRKLMKHLKIALVVSIVILMM